MEEDGDRDLHIPHRVAGILAGLTNALGPQQLAEETSAQGALPEIFGQVVAIEVGHLIHICFLLSKDDREYAPIAPLNAITLAYGWQARLDKG
jgi:hypothetical protein